MLELIEWRALQYAFENVEFRRYATGPVGDQAPFHRFALGGPVLHDPNDRDVLGGGHIKTGWESLLLVHAKEGAVMNKEAFLRRAVHNLAIDQYRRDRSGLRRGVSIEEVNRLIPLMAPGPTPDQILESQQRLDCLIALLDAVNPRTRKIYFAHRSGYTYAEIADDMGIAEITIRRHIARAQAALPKVND